jgi:hypothetical protein
MTVHNVNLAAVSIAAISMFVLGAIWYSPALFGGAWMRANRLTEADLKNGNPAVIFGGAFVLALVMSANLAAFLAQPATTVGWGAMAGFLAGFGWVSLAVATIALFERRSWTYILVNGGYMTVAFVVMGLILGAWR